MVEETQVEEFEPGSRIWFGAVEELKGGGQFPVERTGTWLIIMELWRMAQYQYSRASVSL